MIAGFSLSSSQEVEIRVPVVALQIIENHVGPARDLHCLGLDRDEANHADHVDNLVVACFLSN